MFKDERIDFSLVWGMCGSCFVSKFEGNRKGMEELIASGKGIIVGSMSIFHFEGQAQTAWLVKRVDLGKYFSHLESIRGHASFNLFIEDKSDVGIFKLGVLQLRVRDTRISRLQVEDSFLATEMGRRSRRVIN